MDAIRERAFSAEAFRAWLTRRRWTYVAAAEALGCTRNTVSRYAELGAPYYIGLACAAIDHDLEPPEAQ